MKKLRLCPTDLRVLSFPTADVDGGGGTVYGAGFATPGCPPDTLTYAKPCLPTYNLAATNPCICLG